MRKIPVIICIDIEPDQRRFDRRSRDRWLGHEGTFPFFRKLRLRLAAATASDVHYSWFLRMDPQVEETYGPAEWAAQTYARDFEEVRAEGDEIGLHTHAWKWDESRREWIIDYTDRAWTGHCLDVSFGAFRRFFGEDCRAFRFGDHWMDGEVMRRLESYRVKYDLTIEAGQDDVPAIKDNESWKGRLPDYSKVSFSPFRPSGDDFRMPAARNPMNLWEIPISTDRACGRFRGLRTKLRRLFPRRVRQNVCHTLHLGTRPDRFARGVQSILARMEKPILVFSVRSSISLQSRRFHNMERNVEFLAAHPAARSFVFSTPGEAVAHLGLAP